MNILLSSVGKQSFLVKEFQKALDKKGIVVVTDFDENAIGFKSADKHYIAPPYNDINYVSWLLNICETEKISLLFSLNVDDLLILEENRERFDDINCFIVGGNLDNIKITYDKYLLLKFCEKLEIDTPETYLLEEILEIDNVKFPIIAKPCEGKGSRGNFIVENFKELKTLLEENEHLFKDEPYVFQQLIEGEEYGVDLVNNFHSEFEAVFVRKKFQMKNGETYEAITSSKEEWTDIAKKISRELKHQGIIDLDFLVLGEKKYLIDINHRFGGGYIFSHAAGAELPKVFVNWFLGKNIESLWLNPKENIHSRRGDSGVKIIENEN